MIHDDIRSLTLECRAAAQALTDPAPNRDRLIDAAREGERALLLAAGGNLDDTARDAVRAELTRLRLGVTPGAKETEAAAAAIAAIAAAAKPRR